MGRRAKPAKAKAEAKRPLARKSPKNEGSGVRDLQQRLAESLEREKAKDRALAEALDRQTATSEILRVISSSPTDVQSVLDAIAAAAHPLCEADNTSVFRFDGDLIHFEAHRGRTPEEIRSAQQAFPQPLRRQSVTARAILAAALVQIADVSKDPELEESLRIFRTVLSVPLIRDGRPLGAITLARRVVRPFTDKHIALLETFADHAVIAIENARLFTELQQKNEALTQAHAQVTEALEQQTATSEILRVISGSPTDLQPVFETIVRSAVLLCDATFGGVALRDGDRLTLPAAHGLEAADLETFLAPFPVRLGPDTVSGCAILEGRVVHVRDQAAEPAYSGNPGQRVGTRSIVAVPMFRDGSPIGAITVWRREVRPFTDAQIELLKTFADQAAIAIENARLFKELEERNHELTTALDQQTATSDILRVISRSQTDVQPVFDAIVASAVRLLGAYSGTLTRLVGDQIELVALSSTDAAGDAVLRAADARIRRRSSSQRHCCRAMSRKEENANGIETKRVNNEDRRKLIFEGEKK